MNQREKDRHQETDAPRGDITRILLNIKKDPLASQHELIPLVYGELRKISAQYMRKESPGHELQPTALVNEAYLRLVNIKDVDWQSRSHFFAIASQIMRRILVDHARAAHAKKRGGPFDNESLDAAVAASVSSPERFLALNEALERLSKRDARQAQIVELRFFGGLSEVEVAQTLSISVGTVKRDWRMARAWLFDQLKQPT